MAVSMQVSADSLRPSPPRDPYASAPEGKRFLVLTPVGGWQPLEVVVDWPGAAAERRGGVWRVTETRQGETGPPLPIAHLPAAGGTPERVLDSYRHVRKVGIQACQADAAELLHAERFIPVEPA